MSFLHLRFARKLNSIPLSWAGGTLEQKYLNLGDALSPCIVAALSRKKISRISMKSDAPRLSSTGSILSNFVGGSVIVWGSGMSPTYNPILKKHVGWSLPSNTEIIPYCLRGPYTSHILSKGGVHNAFNCAYGDPVLLLKRFYNPQHVQSSKSTELGVIIHLSETNGRELNAKNLPEIERYQIPETLADSIKIINTLSDVSSRGLSSKIDEILSCKRIVSTSFHGLLLAELYGIPCLYLSDKPGGIDVANISLSNDQKIDTRFLDFFLSAKINKRYYYRQEKARQTDWDSLISLIDQYWDPIELNDSQLIESFPFDLKPIQKLNQASDDFFDHDLIQNITYQGNPVDIMRYSKRIAKRFSR
jgi:pyruvyltransferase